AEPSSAATRSWPWRSPTGSTSGWPGSTVPNSAARSYPLAAPSDPVSAASSARWASTSSSTRSSSTRHPPRSSRTRGRSLRRGRRPVGERHAPALEDPAHVVLGLLARPVRGEAVVHGDHALVRDDVARHSPTDIDRIEPFVVLQPLDLGLAGHVIPQHV